MRKATIILCIVLGLCSCGHQHYEYADQLIDCYEETLEQYEEAETLSELEELRIQSRAACEKIETEQTASREELIKDITSYDENAYLIHLELLRMESYSLWMYHKKKNELSTEK